MKFSQRHGYTPVSNVIQIESINTSLRTAIWNTLDDQIFSNKYFLNDRFDNYGQFASEARIFPFSRLLWANFFNHPVDTRPANPHIILTEIRNWYFKAPWHEIYDFIEFVAGTYKGTENSINQVLEKELAGYRIIDGLVTPIISAPEIASIETSISESSHSQSSIHIRRALELLSNKTSPDYRNSIKESISAVEAIAKTISGKDNATLSDALKVLEDSHGLHKALREGFIRIYGYTSDANGIRHALMEEDSLSLTEATYFLVSCSAFINYLSQLAK